MLYHYTDFAAFDGIIRCAELRLNNILNMNDASEMRLFMNGICKAVIARLKADKEQDKIYKLETFFQNEMEEEFHYSAYAACFSKYRDDAAQWERYGKFGQGVCIAFHEEILRRMLGGSISLQEVFYQEDMGEHHLVNEFYKLISASSELAESLPALQNLMNDAWVQSAAFKHPSFACEHEVRLVVSPFLSDEFPIEPKYHVSDRRIKKYYPLDLNKMCRRLNLQLSDLIGEIIIGPTSSQSLPILQDYLADNGLGVLSSKISLSNCPLRRPIS